MKKSVFVPTDILIPEIKNLDDWSVIACDQFTSEREYWDRVSARVNETFSTFHMVLPEAYLNDVSTKDAVIKINSTMENYLNADIFGVIPHSFIYVERRVTGGIRHGLVGALDLEAYEYILGKDVPVRASESTVVERLPIRTEIRRGALLELPHVMVLIDDEKKTVIEPLRRKISSFRKVYDFDLMEDGGHIRGYAVTGEEADRIVRAVDALGSSDVQIVVGDGNHSLAAAKESWERLKMNLTPEERENHPARYALVELNNVYDEGIVFEPIHRIVFNTNPEKLIEILTEKLWSDNGRIITCIYNNEKRNIRVRGKNFGSMMAAFQDVLEEYAVLSGGVVDYIHDDDALRRLTKEENSIGFLMPAMDKADLFRTVSSNGVFPKKSFSIGHAKDKRYYLECRTIK